MTKSENLQQFMELEKEKINNELHNLNDANIEQRMCKRTAHSLFAIMLCEMDIKLAKSSNEDPWETIKEYINIDSKKYENSPMKDTYSEIIKKLNEKITELEES